MFLFWYKMGKKEVENLDLKNKLNIVSGIIANAKKDLESLKTEISNVLKVTVQCLKKVQILLIMNLVNV